MPDFRLSDFSGSVYAGTFTYFTEEGDELCKIPLWKIIAYIEYFDMNSVVVTTRKALDGNPSNDSEKIGYTPALQFLKDNLAEVSRLYYLDNLRS